MNIWLIRWHAIYLIWVVISILLEKVAIIRLARRATALTFAERHVCLTVYVRVESRILSQWHRKRESKCVFLFLPIILPLPQVGHWHKMNAIPHRPSHFISADCAYKKWLTNARAGPVRRQIHTSSDTTSHLIHAILLLYWAASIGYYLNLVPRVFL